MLVYLLAQIDDDAQRQQFIALYEQYRGRMEAVARRILPTQADVEDAMQNAFVQVIRNFKRISEISCEKLPFYLISIVKNESLELLRKTKPTVPLEDWDGAAAGPAGVPTYRALVRCIMRLPETLRTALELKLLFGYSNAEIAQKLGLSESAVAMRISRGRKQLQEILEQEGFFDD